MDNANILPELTTEQKILNAARRVFQKKGYDGARMQEIADEAGFNKALVHYYYRSKEKLFEEIFREAFSTLLPGLAQVFSGQGSITQKIELFVEKYLQVVMEHPYIPVFVLSEMHRNPDTFFSKFVHPEMKEKIKGILQLFEEARKRGEITAIDPRHLLMNIMSLCVFPFVARPMLQRVLDLDDLTYHALLQERAEVVSRFILNAISNQS